ncbi:Acylamino-acid-releasing enzyme 1 [Camellia lanceoleosa]|uniref:Acylamino-acid-releasing enzyme 1 n=1 Tax=Camellia lanceoleosa TaxID=1840588 RepID=A0ACC0GQI7_9ERIC|nr:Acylamino-acid-releasing enzyme 1 [Camellia lanceoleosa]
MATAISQWSVSLLRSLPRLASLSLPLSSSSSPLHRLNRFTRKPLSLSPKQNSVCLAMDGSVASPLKEFPVGLDEATEEEFSSQSKLLQEFSSISIIDKAWTFKSNNGKCSEAMFSISQPNLLANKKRKHILSSHILKGSNGSVSFQWAQFPIEMTGVSTIVPSPSSTKLLVVRNSENETPTQFEIWGASQVEKEFHIPHSTHGSVYSDGWFEGISWNSDETLIAYVAEEPAPSKPTFNGFGYKKGGSADKDCGSWKGQGDWEEDWGETYSGKRRPVLFVININRGEVNEDVSALNLTQSISSAFFPCFSPDGKYLVFLSAKSAVPVVMCAEDDCIPGLYCSGFLSKPWLSDGYTMILSSYWRSTQAILSVNVVSGNVVRISPSDSNFSWNVLTLDGDNIVAVCSSPIDVPQIKYGYPVEESSTAAWSWADISSPISRCSEKVGTLLSSLQFSVMKIPVRNVSENLSKGASKPFEAIFVSSKSKKSDACDPLIVMLHGGPHSVSLTTFSKSLAFLSSIGYSLLIVNYRGSLGFGEEALQSLPGKVGSQDVNDVLTAIDHVVGMGLADPSKIAVLGGSHGGFLTTHLIGQAPDKFAAAAVRNPVCNLALMVGTSDIPDWCYVETCGSEGKTIFTEAPSAEHLSLFHSKSPISHLSRVKTPTLILLGAQDLRVPISNGLQYARALKEKGTEVKVIVFPNDVHGIEKPQSDFESFLNIGVWFKKYCK